jgi:hypothetical protein
MVKSLTWQSTQPGYRCEDDRGGGIGWRESQKQELVSVVVESQNPSGTILLTNSGESD